MQCTKKREILLSNCVHEYLYNFLIFSALSLSYTSFDPEFSEENLTLYSYMGVFPSVLWKIDFQYYTYRQIEAYLSVSLCWLRLTHTLDIVPAGTDI